MDRQEYWDAYYTRAKPCAIIPSQFAAFVASEYLDGHQVVEFGCGNGRDALFFASVGAPVLGVDQSSAAIALCVRQAKARGLEGTRFLRHDLRGTATGEELSRLVHPDRARLLYARFFLHAITEEDEACLFALTTTLMGSRDLLALEFRTSRDRDLPKLTNGHFRRYVDPPRVLRRAAEVGLSTLYFIEGFGYAKYHCDDAHVARVVFQRAR